MRLAVLFVHGIGEQKKDWAEKLIRDFSGKLLNETRRILGDKAPSSWEEIVEVQAIYWKDVFEEKENHLFSILSRSTREALKAKSSIFIALFRSIVKIFLRFQAKIITGYIGDIIGYLNADARRAVYARMEASLKALERPADSGKRPLTIVSHSLGTVISSDFVYDRLKAGGWKEFDPSLRFDNFFTVGSPLALFSLRYGGPEVFQTPIRVEAPHGRWINIYDTDDPVGMPLKVLNEAYNAAVLQDVRVDAGLYGIAHIAYFEKSKTLDIVAKKLALDWAFLSGKLSDEEAKEFYAEYDRSLSGISK